MIFIRIFLSFFSLFCLLNSSLAQQTITTDSTDAVNLTFEGDTENAELWITLDGNLVVSDGHAVYSDSSNNDDGIVPQTLVNVDDFSNGISAVGADNSAVHYSGEYIYYSSLLIQNGTVTSEREGGGTVELVDVGLTRHNAATRYIDLDYADDVDGTTYIMNTANQQAAAIYIANSNSSGDISNAGIIISSNESDDFGTITLYNLFCEYYLDDVLTSCDDNGKYEILNSGTISAPVEENAIYVENNNEKVGGVNITNNADGNISGDIRFVGNNVNSITNDGSISGRIFTVRSDDNGESPVLTINNRDGASIVGHMNIVGQAEINNVDENTEDNDSTFISGDMTFGSGLVTINNTGALLTGDIDLGTNSSSQLNLNSGFLTGDVVMSTGQKLNFSGGALTGNITGAGTVDFGDNDVVAMGDFAIFENVTLDLGSGTHILTADIDLKSGANLAFDITQSGYGSVVAENNNEDSEINSDTNLLINIATDARLSNGGNYTVFSADGGSFEAILDDNINVNSSNANSYGAFDFSTSINNNQLIVTASLKNAAEISSNILQQNIYNLISSRENVSGNFLTAQNYILQNNQINNTQRKKALDSLRSNDVGLNQTNFTLVNQAVVPSFNRLSSFRTAKIAKNYKVLDRFAREKQEKIGLYAKNNKSSRYDVAFSEDDKKDYEIWGQFFGSQAKQKTIDNFSGFENRTMGFSFGLDKKIDDKNMVGVSFAYSDSDIDDDDNIKSTQIDSYQINGYFSKKFADKFYLDGLVGFALNDNYSMRTIISVSDRAEANYYSQNYFAKTRLGFVENFKDRIEIAPELALTYIYSNIEDYQEEGAGNLNLTVRSDNPQFFEGELALNFSMSDFDIISGYNIIPKIRLAYGYDFLGNEQISNNLFSQQNLSFVAQSSEINRHAIKLNAGIDIFSQNDIAVSAYYYGEKRDNYLLNGGFLKFKYNFSF